VESSPWLKLITIGLVLAALAVGYFLVSGRFTSNKTAKQQVKSEKQVQGVAQTAVEPSPTPSNAYSRIVERNKSGIQVLPKTGNPAILISIISLSAIASGWGLKKFPH